MENKYKGYSLFKDIEDFTLRARNRGIVMANILEDNLHDGRMSYRGMKLVKEYLKRIPLLEQEAAAEACHSAMVERGYN